MIERFKQKPYLMAASVLTMVGIGCIIGGAFTSGMSKEVLMLGGSILTTILISTALGFILLNYRKVKNIDTKEVNYIRLTAFSSFAILGFFACGYVGSYIRIGPFLGISSVAQDFACRAAIGGALALVPAILMTIAIHNSSIQNNQSPQSCMVLIVSLTAGTALATVAGPLITNAAGLTGDIQLVTDIFIGVSVMALLFAAVYGIYGYFKQESDLIIGKPVEITKEHKINASPM